MFMFYVRYRFKLSAILGNRIVTFDMNSAVYSLNVMKLFSPPISVEINSMLVLNPGQLHSELKSTLFGV